MVKTDWENEDKPPWQEMSRIDFEKEFLGGARLLPAPTRSCSAACDQLGQLSEGFSQPVGFP